jgi:hypothetical protein
VDRRVSRERSRFPRGRSRSPRSRGPPAWQPSRHFHTRGRRREVSAGGRAKQWAFSSRSTTGQMYAFAQVGAALSYRYSGILGVTRAILRIPMPSPGVDADANSLWSGARTRGPSWRSRGVRKGGCRTECVRVRHCRGLGTMATDVGAVRNQNARRDVFSAPLKRRIRRSTISIAIRLFNQRDRDFRSS